MSQLRVGTFNVHGFSNRHSEPTIDGIHRLLNDADLDIIGLQEASRRHLKELAQKLDYTVAVAHGGTALLTRLPVSSHSKPFGPIRCCSARIHLPESASSTIGSIDVAVLHLDHRREEKRLKEVAQIVQTRHQQGLPLFDVWLGDFNALTKPDYSTKKWARIADIRSLNHWEQPVSELTLAMTSPPTKKSKQHNKVAPLGLCDAYHSSPPNTIEPMGTSRFDTRIDYIYYRPESLVGHGGWTIVSCQHIAAMEVSDHNLVVATFEKQR